MEEDEDFMSSLEATMKYRKRVDEENKPIHAELIRRSAAADITCEKQVDEDGDEIGFILSMPSGREKRLLYLSSTNEVKNLLTIPFEKYTFLSGYRAICSYEDGEIETAIRFASNTAAPSRAILDRLGLKLDDKDNAAFILSNADKGISFRIGFGSAAFKELLSSYLTLTISGLKVSKHDQAIEYLIRLSNALFFEIDLSLRLPITLVRHRSISMREKSGQRRGKPTDLQFPHSEYDEAAMSLYWYAKSASGMPLLQFLAYYQTVEFYFPAYSETEAQRRIQNILKDPTFNPYKITDISRLLTMIKSGTSRGFGDELTQLSATVHACLDPQALWTFLTEDDNRKEALSKGKVLAKQKLPLADKYTDLRELIAIRIYEIRCKVVHTKSDSRDTELDILLPFSREAESLDHGIDLIQYVAQQVLIASSRPLQI